jgi:filamentous hemagglutinin family protein
MRSKFSLSLLTITSLVFSIQSAVAQQIPIAQPYKASDRIPVADSTQIGTQVSGNGSIFNITGGVNKGQTLFHSFTDFSVPTNGTANFVNITNPRDIITRVTGNVFSDINGTVNTNGANFFLINPNGIVFGTNAQLNVGRAFVGSTANSIDLVDAGGRTIKFGTNPNGDALLSVAPNVLFNVSSLTMGGGSGEIKNFGTLQTTNPDRYIGLIGGNVNLNGGKIIAPGGRVELGGLSAVGSVSWSQENNVPKLIFPEGVTRSNVTLTDTSSISVAGGGGGSITVNAQNFNVLNGSNITAGISQNAPNSQAGDINIDAIGNIEIGGNSPSFIRNEVFKGAVGNSGKVTITTDGLQVTGGSQISSSTLGIGNAGDMIITANNVSVSGESPNASTSESPFPGGLLAEVKPNATGKAGNLTLTTKILNVSDGGKVQSATFGNGDGGNLFIKADEINVFNTEGVNPYYLTNINAGVGFDRDRNIDSAGKPILARGNGGKLTIETGTLSVRNGASVSSDTRGIGNAGDLTITTNFLQILDGADITSSTSQIGDAGKITINAQKVEIDREIPRTNNSAPIPTGLFSQVEANATGNAGDIILNTKTLSVSNGGKVQSATFGNGNSGNVFIKADDEINVFNSPNSTPGQLTNINTGVSFDIDRNKDSAGNPVFAQGNGGKLTIETNRLSIRNGVAISSNTTGIGSGGDISITADNLEIINNSSLSTDTSGIGNAGNIDIHTNGNIYVSENSKISSSTLLQGETGKITIHATGNITLNNGSSILSAIVGTAQGNSNGIKIENARDLTLSNNSTIQTDNGGGIGNAGNIDIKTTGNIKIIGADSQNPLLQNNPNLSGISSGISSSTFGEGDTGKITIDTTGDITLSNGGGIFSAIASGTIQGFELKGKGNSQGIKIKKSRNLILTNNGFISTNNINAQGDAGDIIINSQGEVNLNTSGISSGSIGQGKAANILINSTQLNLNKSFVSTNAFFGSGGNITVAISDLLLLRNNSGISTNSSSNGGNITIGDITNRPLVVAVPGNNDITANAIQGNGGTLTISSQGLFGIQFRPKGQESNFTSDITANSISGRDGNVNIDTPGSDPGRDSTELPNTTTDASNQISQVCSASNRQNKLTVTGRGGLPPNANDPLTSDVVWQDVRAASSQPAVSSATTNPVKLAPPAVGWVFDGKGKVTLIAVGSQPQAGTSVACPQGVGK